MKPKSLSFRLARFFAIVIFAFSAALFFSNFVVTVIPREADVFNSSGEIIGKASLPNQTEEFGLIFLAFGVCSGFQIWTLSLIGKEKSNHGAEPAATDNAV